MIQKLNKIFGINIDTKPSIFVEKMAKNGLLDQRKILQILSLILDSYSEWDERLNKMEERLSDMELISLSVDRSKTKK